MRSHAPFTRESTRITGAAEHASIAEATLGEKLTAFGERLLRFLADPEMIGFERLIAAASAAYPELPGRFYKAGPGRARSALAALIADGANVGELELADADQAAEDLVGLWQGMMRVELSMGSAAKQSKRKLRQRAERGVALFFRLYGANGNSASR